MSDTTYKSKVGYKPPVELDYHEGTPEIKSVWDNMRDSEGKILEQLEEHIVAQCSVAVGVKIDREELIKALQYDRGQYEKGYADGKRDAAAAIEELQADVDKLKDELYKKLLRKVDDGKFEALEPHWVSVDDEYPEPFQVVLVRRLFNPDEVTLAYYGEAFTGMRLWNCLRTPIDPHSYEIPWVGAGRVTHWMPLPEPPQEVQDADK